MKKTLVAIVLFASIYSSLFGEVNQNDDFQLWFYDAIHKDLTDKAKLYLEGELRYGDNASTLYIFYLQTRFLYSINKRLEIAPGYRQLWFLELMSRNWSKWYEPFIDITLKFNIKNWEISDRNRPFHLFFDGGPNLWGYRNRLMINTPWKLGKMKLNPVIFDEVFFRETLGLFENRLGLGFAIPLKDKNNARVFYILRHIEIETWRANHILWFQFDFAF